MTLSDNLYLNWSFMCAVVVGAAVPINAIAPGFLSHVVLDSDPPLVLCDGEAVRQLTLQYGVEEDNYGLRA